MPRAHKEERGGHLPGHASLKQGSRSCWQGHLGVCCQVGRGVSMEGGVAELQWEKEAFSSLPGIFQRSTFEFVGHAYFPVPMAGQGHLQGCRVLDALAVPAGCWCQDRSPRGLRELRSGRELAVCGEAADYKQVPSERTYIRNDHGRKSQKRLQGEKHLVREPATSHTFGARRARPPPRRLPGSSSTLLGKSRSAACVRTMWSLLPVGA